MPPRRNNIVPSINVEWAKSLIGLSMRVPDHWWDGYKGHKLRDGKIHSFDTECKKWNLLLDTQDDDDDLYLMNYNAVCEYSDEDSSTFHEYHLTYHAVRDGDEEIETAEGTTYTKTTFNEWNQVEDGKGRTVDPIEWTGDEEFPVKITDEEVKTLMDDDKEIRYKKVIQWCLPRYGNGDDEKSLFEFQAARMRNYMGKRVVEEGYKPRYYTEGKAITQVIMLLGSMVLVLVKCLLGGRSIDQIFSTREIFDAVPSIQAAMTKGALEDLTTCLHYSDDWDPKENGVWDDIYADPKVVDEGTAPHRLKHG
jgi:hypothetical protein